MPMTDSTSTAPLEELLNGVVSGSLETLPEVCRRHRVLLLVLFGSTVKGRRHEESDLDLAVLFDGESEDDSWILEEDRLAIELEELLRPRCDLSLVALNRATELLQKEVSDHGVVLYADDPHRWLLYRISANRRFEDTEKYRRRRWQELCRKYRIPTDVTAS
jgi:predicted nucleotidyltransferase